MSDNNNETKTLRYAKFISETKIDEIIPHTATINGKFYINVRNNPGALYNLGYHIVRTEEYSGEVDPTCERLVTRYRLNDISDPSGGLPLFEIVEYKIVERFEVPIVDPSLKSRRLSKMKLFENLYAAGLWDEISVLIDSNDYIKNVWMLSVTIDEDHQLVQQLINQLRTAHPDTITDEVIENILNNSISEL